MIPVKFALTQYGAPTCGLLPATIALTRTAGGTLVDGAPIRRMQTAAQTSESMAVNTSITLQHHRWVFARIAWTSASTKPPSVTRCLRSNSEASQRPTRPFLKSFAITPCASSFCPAIGPARRPARVSARHRRAFVRDEVWQPLSLVERARKEHIPLNRKQNSTSKKKLRLH